MIKNSFPDRQTQREILRAVEMLLDQPAKRKKALQILDSLYERFLEKEHIFSLDSIVFGGFVQEARSKAAQWDPSILSAPKDMLLGTVPYRSTFAMKYNFVEFLRGDTLDAYKKIKMLLSMLARRVGVPPALWDASETYDDLRESLYELCYEQLRTDTIYDLLIAQACHAFLILPDDGSEYFDLHALSASFGSIYSVSSTESIDTHLAYIESILQKLEGKAVLFVDVHLLPEGFVVNLR